MAVGAVPTKGNLIAYKKSLTLARTGYDPKFGARPLRRLIQRTVEDTISEEMLAGNIRLGENLRLYMDDQDQVRVAKQVMNLPGETAE